MNDGTVREKMFEERLKAIHALSRSVEEESAMGTNREEILAMFDSFLGEDFDPSKRERVIGLQQDLHQGQTSLARQLESGAITSAEYADRFNHLAATVFADCEEVLGRADFETLFGAPRSEMQGYIDKDRFVAWREPAAATPMVPQNAPASKPHPHAGQTVLIVDASKKSRVLLRGALKRAGYRVMAADSGWAALEWLKTRHPDVLVIDIAMPTMSGYELVELLHKRPKTADVRVFMMASEITAITRTEALRVGASEVIMKSIAPEQLVSSINRTLAH